MRFLSVPFVLSTLAFTLSATAIGAEAWLVKGGEPQGRVVIAKEASPELRESARLLGEYLEKATGATLPVVHEAGAGANLHLGRTPWVEEHAGVPEKLDEDGYLLKRVDAENFVIVGGGASGDEFGIYEFLERYLGVRWLAPTELFTEIPKRSDLALPEGEQTSEPVFLSREFFPIVRERSPEEVATLERPHMRPYLSGDQWGRVNRLRARIDFHHYLKRLLPPSKYGKSNPEFFPILNGKRMIPPDDEYYQWQPNFSAPGIVEASAAEILDYLKRHPQKTSYSLGINDSHRYDQSEASKKRRSGRVNRIGLEDVSDDYFQWANEVAQAVKRERPEVKFGFLAYLALLEVPTAVSPDPSLVPFITYEMTRWFDPELRERMQRLTKEWGAVSPELGWYDYLYGGYYPVPRFFPHAISEALRWGRQHKVKHYYAEVIPNWGEGPNPWIITRLLWNPEQEVGPLLDEWYNAAVGPEAAPSLKAYYALWEKFWEEDARRSRWYSNQQLWLDYTSVEYLSEVSAELLEKSDALLKEAVERTDTPVRRQRAEKLQTMWQIYRAAVVGVQGDGIWREADLTDEAAALAWLDRCEAIIAQVRERQRMLGALKDDPLFAHSIYRYTSSEMQGERWGATPLWALVPWVGKSEAVRARLGELAATGAQAAGERYLSDGSTEAMKHDASKVAAMVLQAGQGRAVALLNNGSFEEGLEGWPEEQAFQTSTAQAADGKHSLKISGIQRAELRQSLPYQVGQYYVTAQVYLPEATPEGVATLTLRASDAKGTQQGPLLPEAKVALRPGRWNTMIFPFELQHLSVPVKELEYRLSFESFNMTEVIHVDGLGLYRVGDEAGHSQEATNAGGRDQ